MNKQYSQRWLEILCAQMKGLDSAVFMMPEGSENRLKPLARYPASIKNFSDFSQLVKYALKKREPVHFSQTTHADQPSFDLFALPVFSKKKLLAILIIKIAQQPESHHKAIFAVMRQSLKWLKLAGEETVKADDFYTRVVALMAACFEQTSYQQGLVSMVTELTQTFACERVAFAEYQGHYSKIVALSNSASFDDRSNLVQAIADAMDEAIEQDNAIVYPDSGNKLIQRDHQELSRKFGIGSVCTLPLIHDNEVFGAITLLRGEQNPFDRETLNLCQQAFSLITPYLALKREQEKSLFLKIGSALKTQLQNVFGVRHMKLKLASIVLAAMLIGATLLQGEFRVTADAVLEGKIQRVVSAPFSGYLLSSSVRAGDTVQKDQVMASLNDEDIQLQMAKLRGELQKNRQEYREAQSSRDLVKVRVVNEQINQTSAEMELTRQQLQRINLTAPFDGVVIEGDLSQSLGAPVERGEALFKIAPLEGYRIILKVDESQISYIEQGQSGSLILPSLTERHFPLKVEKITVAAKAEDGANIFRVEASLDETTDLLRPGMQGVGKINAGRNRLIWIWTHEITDWFRLWLWSWLP